MVFQIIAVQAVVFFLILFVLRKMLYTESAKESRRLHELKQENFAREKEIVLKEQELKTLYSEKLAKAEEDAKQLRRQAEAEIEELRNSLTVSARQEAARIIKDALSSKEKIRDEISFQNAGQAPALALHIFKKALSPEMILFVHKELVREVAKKAEELDRGRLISEISNMEILTACALSGEEKDALFIALSVPEERRAGIGEKLDSSLIAGVVVRLSTMVIDGSLLNKLRTAESG